MSISKKDIRKIFLKAVQRYPMVQCGGVNSYASIQSMSDLRSIDTNNAKKIYEDYLQGLFWSRNWDFTGADPNKLHREFPTLATIFSTTTTLGLSYNCESVTIAILDNKDCRDCSDACKRSQEIIEDDCGVALTNILQYLSTFKKYYIQYPDDSTAEVWDTWNFINELIAKGDIKKATEMSSIDKHVDLSKVVEINQFNIEGTTQELVGKTMRLTFCGCYINDLQFATSMPKVEKIGTTLCATCV